MNVWKIRLGEYYVVRGTVMRVWAISNPHPTSGEVTNWRLHCQREDGSGVLVVIHDPEEYVFI